MMVSTKKLIRLRKELKAYVKEGNELCSSRNRATLITKEMAETSAIKFYPEQGSYLTY
jgi:hypothetical protein